MFAKANQVSPVNYKPKSPILAALNRTPHQHVLTTLTEFPLVDLETALMFLPLNHVMRLLEYLAHFVSKVSPIACFVDLIVC
jgi:hypothetical protein